MSAYFARTLSRAAQIRSTIVAFRPAGERYARSRRDKDLGIGPALRIDEVAAVDHRGRKGAVVNHRSGAGTPRGSRAALVEFGRVIAEELEAVAALDQRASLPDQPLQLDGFHLGAILFALEAALGLLVVVEIALDAVKTTVEQVDHRPEHIGQVGLEARIGQHGDDGVEAVVQEPSGVLRLGQGPWIRLILEGAVPVQLQGLEKMRRRRGGFRVGQVGTEEGEGGLIERHDRLLGSGWPRPSRPSRRSQSRRRNGAAPSGRSAAEDGGGRLVCSARSPQGGERSRPTPLRPRSGRLVRPAPPARSPSQEGRARRSPDPTRRPSLDDLSILCSHRTDGPAIAVSSPAA